jgi:hypothetical protein
VSSRGNAIGSFHHAAVVRGQAVSSSFPSKTPAQSNLTGKIFPPGMVVVLAERAPSFVLKGTMRGGVPLQCLVSR